MIAIRRAKKSDFSKIIPIFKEVFSSSIEKEWTSLKIRKRIDYYRNEGYDLFIAIDNKATIGFLIARVEEDNERYAFIEELAVSNKFQGQGVGAKLIEYVEKFYKKNKVKTIVLICDTEHIKTLEFYKKRGYKKTTYTELHKKL